MNRKFESLILYYKKFGIYCSIAVFLSKLFPFKDGGTKLSWIILQCKHLSILRYLDRKYYSKVEAIDISNKGGTTYKKCIWTAWLQGEENAPEVVRLTLASIRKNSNGHRVIVLTNDNIGEYVDIPLEIKRKYCAGVIGNAHYADIVRMMILSKYGGLWLDATTFVYEKIDNNSFFTPFYSIGVYGESKSRFISNNKWVVGVIGGSQDSLFLSQISEMLIAYWLENDLCVDYFVFDYLIAVLYQNDKCFKSIVDLLPQMKNRSNKLRHIINEPYRPGILDEVFKKNQVYHLTYKQSYQKQTDDGRITIYGYMYNNMFGDQHRNE